jgi:hypothetical protein
VVILIRFIHTLIAVDGAFRGPHLYVQFDKSEGPGKVRHFVFSVLAHRGYSLEYRALQEAVLFVSHRPSDLRLRHDRSGHDFSVPSRKRQRTDREQNWIVWKNRTRECTQSTGELKMEVEM